MYTKMMRVGIMVLVGLLLVSGSSRAATSGPPAPSVDELTNQFRAIIFGTEFRGFKPLNRIKKWNGPLRVTVKAYGEVSERDSDNTSTLKLKQVRVNPQHLKHIQKHLETLAALTGLETEDVKNTNKSTNFEIKIVPRNQLINPNLVAVDPILLRRLGGQGGCYFLMWHSEKLGVIDRVVIVVNSDRIDARIEHCLLEEMTQSLGLPNDAGSPWTSIFSNEGYITSLTRADRIMIKTLYDPRLKPAMDREEAMVMARKIIGELDRSMP